MRVIAISARPGDAEFAVGGTLARHRKRGDDVTIVTVANGNSALDDVPPRELASRRRAEAETAAERLGVDLVWMGHSDFAVQADAVTRVKLVEILRARKPDLLLAPAPLGNILDASGAWELARAAIEMAAAPNVLCEGDPLPQSPAISSPTSAPGPLDSLPPSSLTSPTRSKPSTTPSTPTPRWPPPCASPRRGTRRSRRNRRGLPRPAGRRRLRRSLPVRPAPRPPANPPAPAIAPGAPPAPDAPADLRALFGPRGPLAEHLAGYEPRTCQVQMAEFVDGVVDEGGRGVVEADTGTGKTLAYLVPVLRARHRAIVSTSTKALQDQLWTHDLPLAARVAGVARPPPC